MQGLSIRLSPFQRHRLLAIPLLALILLHFIFYQKLPFQEGYRFPWPAFCLLLVIGLLICQCNYVSFQALRSYYKVDLKTEKRLILHHFALGWVATWLLFSILYLIQLWFFQASFNPVRYWGFTLLMLGISSLETSVLLLRELYGYFRSKPADNKIPLPVLEKEETDYGILNVPTGKQILRLKIGEVAYLHSARGIITLQTFRGQRITSAFAALDELESLLDHAPFFRLNRQYLVNRAAIMKISESKNRKLEVHLSDELTSRPTILSVSRYKARDFQQWFNQGGNHR